MCHIAVHFFLINDLSCHAWLEHDVARSSLTIYCFPISVFSHSAFYLSFKVFGMIIYLLWGKDTFSLGVFQITRNILATFYKIISFP